MARGRRRTKAEPKKTYDLISKETIEGKSVFKLITEVLKRWKKDLSSARIGAAWMVGKKPDKDGVVTLGRMKKCSELERQLHQLDAIVLLNQDYWRMLKDEQRLALVHHELCHLDQALDSNGELAYDGHGERKWRLRKHDVEEFNEVIRSHGCYKADIVSFVKEAVTKDPNFSLFGEEEKKSGEKKVGPRAVA
jgi:hypothetical protein